jgi:hypothetical protein
MSEEFNIEYWDETVSKHIKAKGKMLNSDIIIITSGSDEGAMIHKSNNKLNKDAYIEIQA